MRRSRRSARQKPRPRPQSKRTYGRRNYYLHGPVAAQARFTLTNMRVDLKAEYKLSVAIGDSGSTIAIRA